MKIAIGADHAGFFLKEQLRRELTAAGHDVRDFGAESPESSDYPDFARQVAQAVAAGECERGILVCFTGVGMSIAANRVPGVRAALAYNSDVVELTRRHNDANVLTLGAKYLNAARAMEWVRIFLETPFEGGRHERRVRKIDAC
ncbi:MAG: ribose 5-phosphate isomerase B [Bryobacteraceae bacterium]|nr:ribose 5-phosphate isomerase B [Bryobacteraceae bacterium]